MESKLNSHAGPDKGLVRLVRWAWGLVLTLLLSPVLLLGILLAPLGQLQSSPCVMRHGRTFNLLSWRWSGRLGRFLNSSALVGWPGVVHLMRGEMAWVGAGLHSTADAPPPEVQRVIEGLRPGFFSLWGLRQRTATDYDDRWTTELEYACARGLKYDALLVLRYLLAAMFYPTPRQSSQDEVVVDTLRIDNLGVAGALHRVAARLDVQESGPPLQVNFVNVAAVNIARRDVRFRKAVNQAGLNLPEGANLRRAAWFLGTPLRQRVDRMVFIPRLCSLLLRAGAKVFLLGPDRTDAQSLQAEWEQQFPGLQIVGCAAFNEDPKGVSELAIRVRQSGADLLLCGLVSPLQEVWLAGHSVSFGTKAVVALGSELDLARNRSGTRQGGRFKLALAVFLQRILGSVKPLREAPVVIRPGDVRAPTHAIVLVVCEPHDTLLKPFDVVPALLPVGALTSLACALEHLSEKGCRHVDLVTDADPLRLRETVGHGERWGLTIDLHLAQGEADVLCRAALLDVLAADSGADAMPVWLVDAGCWIPHGALGPGLPQVTVWCGPEPDRWAGWACLPRANFDGLFAGDRLETVGRQVVQVASLKAVPVRHLPAGADLGTLAGVIAMTRQPSIGVLEAANWRRLPSDATITGEVWVSREAQVEPGARLVGPVFVGPGCHVASQATLGPGVVLGRDARIDKDAVLVRTVVLDGVAVGQGLEITDSLVHALGIASLTWGSIVPAQALGSLLVSVVSVQRPRIMVGERMLALLLWLLLPVLSLLPGARGDGALARAFRTRLRGGLLSVVAGRRALVGRSSEAEDLARGQWKELEFEPFGAIAVGDTWGADSAEEHVLADIYWSMHRTWPHRIAVLRAYLKALAASKPAVASSAA